MNKVFEICVKSILHSTDSSLSSSQVSAAGRQRCSSSSAVWLRSLCTQSVDDAVACGVVFANEKEKYWSKNFQNENWKERKKVTSERNKRSRMEIIRPNKIIKLQNYTRNIPLKLGLCTYAVHSGISVDRLCWMWFDITDTDIVFVGLLLSNYMPSCERGRRHRVSVCSVSYSYCCYVDLQSSPFSVSWVHLLLGIPLRLL